MNFWRPTCHQQNCNKLILGLLIDNYGTEKGVAMFQNKVS